MVEYIPQWVFARVWPGRSRACPQCGNSFASKFDKGHCPQCDHSFLASEVYGLPQGVTLAQAMEYTPEESKRILAFLTGSMEPVEGFPVPAARENLPQLDREDWEFHRRWLRAAMHEGGTLFAWRQTYPKAMFGGYLVIKEGRLIALMRTEVGLAD